jgi:two-component system response regulator DevR
MTQRRSTRILIVADQPLFRTALRKALTGNASKIVGEVGTAADAIRSAQQLATDVIIFGLDRVNGEIGSVLRGLKAAGPHLRVLVVSRCNDPQVVRQALEGGAAGYVLASASRRKLIAMVRVVSEGGSVIDAALLRELLGNPPPNRFLTLRPADVKVEPLTRVEQEVLCLIAEGLTNKEISIRKRWSLGTTKKYVQNILGKLAASDRTEAAVRGVRSGFLDEGGTGRRKT